MQAPKARLYPARLLPYLTAPPVTPPPMPPAAVPIAAPVPGLPVAAPHVEQCAHQARMIAGRVAADDEHAVGVLQIL